VLDEEAPKNTVVGDEALRHQKPCRHYNIYTSRDPWFPHPPATGADAGGGGYHESPASEVGRLVSVKLCFHSARRHEVVGGCLQKKKE
jgi:hypothetical protein